MVCGERQYCCDETSVYTKPTNYQSGSKATAIHLGNWPIIDRLKSFYHLVISAFVWNLSARVVCLSKDSINGERLKKDIVIGGLLASDR